MRYKKEKSVSTKLIGGFISSLLILGMVASVYAATTIDVVCRWGAEAPRKEVMELVANDYMAEHPGVKIEFDWIPAEQETSRVIASLSAGLTTPDVFYADSDPRQLNSYWNAGWLYNLSDVIPRENLGSGYVQLVDTYSPGIVQTLPLEGLTVPLWYNIDLFEKWGIDVGSDDQLTLAEWQNVMAKAKAEGIVPYGAPGAGWAGSEFNAAMVTDAIGLEKTLGLGDGTTSWADPDIVKALRIAQEYAVQMFPPNCTTLGYNDAYTPFFQGRFATLPMGSWLMGWYSNPPEEGGAPEGFNLGVMRHPAPESNDILQVGYAGGLAINKMSEALQDCIGYLKLFSSPKYAAIWVERTSTPTGLNIPAGAKVHPAVKKQMDIANASQLVPPFWVLLPPAVGDVWYVEGSTTFNTGETSVDHFVSELVRVSEAYFAEQQ